MYVTKTQKSRIYGEMQRGGSGTRNPIRIGRSLRQLIMTMELEI